MSDGTRYACALGCGWHHDEPDRTLDFMALTGGQINNRLVTAIRGRLHEVEDVVRAHAESHPLREWAAALREAQGERDKLAGELETERQRARAIRVWMQEGVAT